MAKRKQQEKVAEIKPEPKERLPYWELFFRGQRSPFIRSQVITAIMSGTGFEVDRLPARALPDVVMLATVTREHFEAEIIDDYTALVRKTDEKWKDPMYTAKMFDQTHLNRVSWITKGFTELNCAEEQYIPELVEWLLQHEVPEYFSEELTEIPRGKKAA